MYQLTTLAEINQRRREREEAAERMRIARTLGRRRSTSRRSDHSVRFRRRAGAMNRQVDER